MNHDCNGDVFERWGKCWGRCFLDSSFFDYEDGIEFCPNCKRPWRGVSTDEKDPDRRHGYIPDQDPKVLIEIDLAHFKRLAEERVQKIAYLEEQLSRWKEMYHKATDASLAPQNTLKGDGTMVDLAMLRAVNACEAHLAVGYERALTMADQGCSHCLRNFVAAVIDEAVLIIAHAPKAWQDGTRQGEAETEVRRRLSSVLREASKPHEIHER
jgi:hypothetical protein